jgi:hypothetical protein
MTAIEARTPQPGDDLADDLSAFLRDVIAELGGKCATCQRLICNCEDRP